MTNTSSRANYARNAAIQDELDKLDMLGLSGNSGLWCSADLLAQTVPTRTIQTISIEPDEYDFSDASGESDIWYITDSSDDNRDYAEERANLLLMHEECEGCETCRPSAFYVSRAELDKSYEAFLADLKATDPDSWDELVNWSETGTNRSYRAWQDEPAETDISGDWDIPGVRGMWS